MIKWISDYLSVYLSSYTLKRISLGTKRVNPGKDRDKGKSSALHKSLSEIAIFSCFGFLYSVSSFTALQLAKTCLSGLCRLGFTFPRSTMGMFCPQVLSASHSRALWFPRKGKKMAMSNFSHCKNTRLPAQEELGQLFTARPKNFLAFCS